MEQKQERRRGHFQRGRRGPDRRGVDRRPQQPKAQERPGRDQVDVEQIMRDIRGRIAQRQGIDLSTQQIQDLAARRLESILDPRTIKPSMLDTLRRAAGAAPARRADKAPTEPAFTFEDTTIYDSHRGALRLIRRLLNPLLKLFFNPNPLIRALHLQAQLNVEAAERDAHRDRQQTEWNALHYEIVQRLVTEVSRGSLELKSLSMRIESLDAKVDFNERRVRGIEGTLRRPRSQSRPAEPVAASSRVEGETAPAETATGAATAEVEGQPPDGTRRRRRGRRPHMSPRETVQLGEPIAADAPSAPSEGPAAPPPTVEQPVQDSRVASAPPEIPAAPPPTVEQPAQDSRVASAPPEIPAAPPPTVEQPVQESRVAPAPPEIPAAPPPTVEQPAQDSRVASAPPEIPAAPPPTVEQPVQESRVAPAPPEIPAAPPPTVEQPAQDSEVAPAPPEIPAAPPPTVEQPAQDSGVAPARLAEQPDAGRNER